MPAIAVFLLILPKSLPMVHFLSLFSARNLVSNILSSMTKVLIAQFGFQTETPLPQPFRWMNFSARNPPSHQGDRFSSGPARQLRNHRADPVKPARLQTVSWLLSTLRLPHHRLLRHRRLSQPVRFLFHQLLFNKVTARHFHGLRQTPTHSQLTTASALYPSRVPGL